MPSFRVLGPLQAEDPDVVLLKGPRHRTVLARLLIARGRVVPVDVLTDDVWSGAPPPGALAALRTFIADLRRALEPNRPPRTPPRLLVTIPPGYALHTAPGTVDADRFEAVAVDPSAPLEALNEALALWRGEAYAEWSTEGWARAEIERLDELHQLATERRAAALLTLGRHAEAASDLRRFVTTHPLREESWRLLALALYRSGRQGDALAALREARQVLAAELGIDPGPSLRSVEADILAQSPTLLPEPPPTPAPVSTAAPPLDAPPAPTSALESKSAPPASARTAVASPGPAASVPVSTASASAHVSAPSPGPSALEPASAPEAAAASAPETAAASAPETAAAVLAPETAAAVLAPETAAASALETAAASAPETAAASAPETAAASASVRTAAAVAGFGRAPMGGAVGREEALAGLRSVGPVAVAGGRAVALVGRDAELARLRSGGRVVLVEGEAGAGKSALVEAFAAELTGWTVLWGRAGEYEGAAGTWPWSDLRTAGAELAARPGPVLLVAEDLHRADQDTLELLTSLPPAVRLLATARDTDPSPQLTAALARLARAEPLRIRLGPLPEPAVAALVHEVVGRAVEGAAVHRIWERSGGNPFFARELARLLAAEGPAALASVPPGVRDVIRHRLAQLSPFARLVLRQASILGRDVDQELLTAVVATNAVDPDRLTTVVKTNAVDPGQLTAAVKTNAVDRDRLTAVGNTDDVDRESMTTVVNTDDVDRKSMTTVVEADVVDALEEATRAGFLQDASRFAHILVRDTVYGDVSAPRRSTWHRAAGEALERLSPDDVFSLAYHFTHAATRGTRPRAARYSALAAAEAERRSNPHEAARLWRQALAHDPAGTDAMLGLSRALALIGHLAESRSLRAAALDAADPVVMLGAFDVPAIWPRNDDEQLSARIVSAATAALPGTGGPVRARLLLALAMELRGASDSRGADAAAEAYALAGDDLTLRALALNARFLHSFTTPGRAATRLALAGELLALSASHDMATFEVLAHLIALQSACALNDFALADTHAAAADRLAVRYTLPVVPVFTQWYAALRLAASGAYDQAESAYRTADAHLATAGMPGMHEGLLGLALLSIDRWTAADDLGPHEPWARPLLLARAGRRTEAGAALRALPPSPHDLLWEARLSLAARAAIELHDGNALCSLAAELRPAAHEHAAGSGVLTFGPVAGYLNRCDTDEHA
ncbi:hypothetical protein GCM10020218_014280 [Dactylosporangium vinaceum]|uniref:BTAD domain-containing putative transcriptional regulator n=1 Tax=Dactylosporangium vinaceum TaxID=53362 RepID=A0ABV5LYZ8_9ACTN|nr:BTAD domain-containing putative transcriptional regulator [Dactylosporangium vinaceum]